MKTKHSRMQNSGGNQPWTQLAPIVSRGSEEKRILLVDDDQQIRDALFKVLEAEGYEVVLAANGEEGTIKFNTEHVDIVLLDLNLPGTNGWDLFGAFTSLNPFLPIIIITGRDNQYRLATAAGVSALMEKPLDVPLLLQTIAALLTEPPESKIKRLVGLDKNVRYAAPLRNSEKPAGKQAFKRKT